MNSVFGNPGIVASLVIVVIVFFFKEIKVENGVKVPKS